MNKENKEPIILAIETALKRGSVAILGGKNLKAFLIGERDVSRSEDLLQMISEVLETANLRLEDINLISVSAGPGSFTGARIGLATAKALAFGMNCAWVGVSALESLACYPEYGQDYERILAVIFSGKGRIYWQYFSASVEENGNDLHDKREQPQVTGIDRFILDFNDLQTEKTFVVIAGAPAEEIHILRGKAKEKTSIYNASDNVAKCIGFQGMRVFTDRRGEIRYPLTHCY